MFAAVGQPFTGQPVVPQLAGSGVVGAKIEIAAIESHYRNTACAELAVLGKCVR